MAERTCSVDGCQRPHWSRGWCSSHYARWRKYGDPGGPFPENRACVNPAHLEPVTALENTRRGIAARAAML